jgi:hypothetical protein
LSKLTDRGTVIVSSRPDDSIVLRNLSRDNAHSRGHGLLKT